MSFTLKVILMLVLVLGLSGCLQHNQPPTPSVPPSEVVDIRNGTFNPDNLTVPANATVIWANHNGQPIEVAADDGSFDSGQIPEGYEYSHIFLQPGVYDYHSKADQSMRGRVSVTYANGSMPAPQAASRAASPAGSVTIGLSAKNIAFNTSKISVPAGANVTINFDNQDSGVPHNLAVYQSSSATSAIFVGDVIAGVKKTTYRFTAPSDPGTYYFQCDVHPRQMNGKFVVTQAGSSQPSEAQPGTNQSTGTSSAGQEPQTSVSGGGATRAQAGGRVPPVAVEINRFLYNPDNITVYVGTTVSWVNYDSVAHTVTAADGSFDSGDIPSGRGYNHTFTEIGRFNYHDEGYPFMEGSIRVIYYTSLPGPGTAAGENQSPVQTRQNAQSTGGSGAAAGNASPDNLARSAPGGNASATSGGTQVQNAVIGLVAKNIAFNTSKISVPAGANVTINFDNQDSGVPHNLAVYQSSSATSAIFVGDVITGVKKTTYRFTAPSDPGTYYFQCDVHPRQMNGKLVVV